MSNGNATPMMPMKIETICSQSVMSMCGVPESASAGGQAAFGLFAFPLQGRAHGRCSPDLLDVARAKCSPVFLLTAVEIFGDASMNDSIALLEMVFVSVSRHGPCPQWLPPNCSASVSFGLPIGKASAMGPVPTDCTSFRLGSPRASWLLPEAARPEFGRVGGTVGLAEIGGNCWFRPPGRASLYRLSCGRGA